jgi:hypothetical protein
MVPVNFVCGWLGMLAGALSGALIGLFFQRDDWLGGYASFRRRLVRLGHIACFGLGFVNVLFALSAPAAPSSPAALQVASWSLVAGAISMPTCCFLCAWRRTLRPLFVVPVAAVVTGILAFLWSCP